MRGDERPLVRKRSSLRHQAQARAHDVCTEHHDVLGATDGGTRSVEALGNSVSIVDRLFGALQRCRDKVTAALAVIRTARTNVLWGVKALVRIAPSVTLEPEVAKVFHMPKGRTDEELLAVARDAMDKIAPFAKEFLAAGLPPKVLTDLPKQIADLAAARLAKSNASREYAITTANIDKELNAGDQAIRVAATILDDSPAAPTDAVRKLRSAKRVGPSTARPVTPASATTGTTGTTDPTQTAKTA